MKTTNFERIQKSNNEYEISGMLTNWFVNNFKEMFNFKIAGDRITLESATSAPLLRWLQKEYKESEKDGKL